MNSWLIKACFDAPMRKRTWKKFSVQLQYGIDLKQAITMQRNRCRQGSPYWHAFEIMLQGLHKGQRLDIALRDYVSVEEAMLLRGGHEGGRLHEAFALCAKLLEGREGIINAVVGAVTYPFILFLLLIVLMLTVSFYVIPQLTLISDPDTWTGAASILVRVSSFTTSSIGIATVVLLLLLCVGSILSLPLWTGRGRLMVEMFPPWSIYRLIAGTSWLYALSMMIHAGLQLNVILEDMLQNTLTPWLKERVQRILEEYQMGKGLGQALSDTKMNFPDKEIVDDLVIYASLPDFSLRLHELAEQWLKDGITQVEKQAKVLNGICLIAISMVLCGIVIGIGSIQQQLTSGMGI